MRFTQLGPGCVESEQGSRPDLEVFESRSQLERDLEQSRAGGPKAAGMERVGGFAQENDSGDAEGRRRADDRPDVFRVLKGDEQSAAQRPGIIVGPCREGRDLDQEERSVGPHHVELLEEGVAQSVPRDRNIRWVRTRRSGQPAEDVL